jgi:hypothetical protein
MAEAVVAMPWEHRNTRPAVFVAMVRAAFFCPRLARERKEMGGRCLDGSGDAPLHAGQLTVMPGHAWRVEDMWWHCPVAGQPLKVYNSLNQR